MPKVCWSLVRRIVWSMGIFPGSDHTSDLKIGTPEAHHSGGIGTRNKICLSDCAVDHAVDKVLQLNMCWL